MEKVLLHIGYPKAASTFLKSWFQNHPQLVYADRGIGGFLSSSDLCAYANKNPDTDLKYLVTSDEEYCIWKGEANPIKFEYGFYNVAQYQQRVCRVLQALFPQAKVLIITRGFEAALKSAYKQYVRAGGTLSLSGFLTRNKDLIVPGWDYNYLVNLYYQYFGTQNVIALPFELLNDNPSLFLETIETALDITHSKPQTAPVNQAITEANIPWYRKASDTMATLVNYLPQNKRQKAFLLYKKKLVTGKLDFLFAKLNRLKPAERPTLQIDAAYLNEFQNKATIFANNILYQNYRPLYFI